MLGHYREPPCPGHAVIRGLLGRGKSPGIGAPADTRGGRRAGAGVGGGLRGLSYGFAYRRGGLALPLLPLVPGHQVIGRVEQVGKDVENLVVGDRVGLAGLGWTCQTCKFCSSQRENLCPDARFTGFHFDGGYAQYVLAVAAFTYHVPENLSAVSAAPLLCAGIIGYRALRLSGIRPGQRLGLYGFGASAHLAIQTARHWNCQVSVFSRGEKHRRLAEKLGTEWTGTIDQ